VRSAILAIAAFTFPAAVTGQVSPPPGLAAIEIARSRACVPIVNEVDLLDALLAPLGVRTDRLLTIAQAIALEDPTIVESLDPDDDVEGRVGAWFMGDAALAQRFVTDPDPTISLERSVARENLKVIIEEAVGQIQFTADSIVGNNQDLAAEAGQCDGAIFVRGPVLEECQAASGVLCDEAAAPASPTTRFRFVDEPGSMWEIQEIRPWSSPAGLILDPTGQLDGARSFVYTRLGNVIVTVAFSPLLLERTAVTAEQLQGYQLTNDSLGLAFTQPDLVFAPALGVRASLPQPLAAETSYVIHFGDPLNREVIWAGAAGTGQALESTIALGAAQVVRLQAGEPLTLSAIREDQADGTEPEFVIELTNVNQGPAIGALLGYMTSQLSDDLTQILQSRGGF
jgi:hypothetical protein